MNQDDVLCPEEAEEFIVEWCKQELGISRPRQSVVQRTFDKIDKNKDKLIDRQELF